MKFYDDYIDVIAFAEQTGKEGNSISAKTFLKTTPIEKIIEWAEKREPRGRLSIVVDDPVSEPEPEE